MVSPVPICILYCRNDLTHYISTHYKGPRMVLAGAGGVDHGKLCSLAEKYFAKIGTDYKHEIPLGQNCRFISY